jgi:hypothetical protein
MFSAVTLVWILAAVLAAVAIAGAAALILKRRARLAHNRAREADHAIAADVASARESFHRRREWLEARFLTLASQSGKPRGLEWLSCDFDDDVAFARDRHSGELRALVAVTIRFEATAGGGMEHVEAVGNLRAATAVFTNHNGEWTTAGRALFNLNPVEAIRFYRNELQGVETPRA